MIMFRNFLFFVLFIGLFACDGPKTHLQNGDAEAYFVKKGEIENPNSRSSRSSGAAGVLCIEGKMYAYYQEKRGGRDGGIGLASTGESCPDINISENDATSQK